MGFASRPSRSLTLNARLIQGIAAVVFCGLASASPVGPTAVEDRIKLGQGQEILRNHSDESRWRFKRELTASVRTDHPAIVPVVEAIRAVSTDPLEQLVMVNDVTHLLVDYDDDARVYGVLEYHATLDEMILRRRDAGWLYLRDDCDGRSVFAAHLLAGLGIPWRLEASYWKRHAWVVATVGGRDYDLIDLGPGARELDRTSYRLFGRWFVRSTQRPPYFQWRHAWMRRTGADVEIGVRLGLLEIGSTRAAMRERFAVDWTKVHPAGQESPFDPATVTARFAGFPMNEALRPSAIAHHVETASDADPARAPLSGASGSD